jgi:Tol biopolymer transport system component
LKPENLFVLTDGRVKILDFGLAKLVQPEASGRALTEMPTATAGTEPGVVLGTLGYMSPEQVRGQAVDSRSDIFSFGAVLYEMLSGRRAFAGASAADTLSAILMTEPPDLDVTGRDMPPAVDRIVRHCLEKNPGERFQSARDIAFDLEALSSISGVTAAIPTPKAARRPRWGTAAAVLLPIATLAAGLFLGRRLAQSPPPLYRQVTYRHGTLDSARFAPDGQSIVYSAAWGGDPLQVFLKRPENPDAQPLGLPGAKLLAVSRSGEMALALNCRPTRRENLCIGTLARAPLTGGSPREVLENVQQADWTPDGSNLLIVRDVGATSRLEFPPGKVLYESHGHLSYPRFSPDGTRIAFFDHSLPADDRGAVAVIDVSGKRPTVFSNWESVHGLAWSPDGREIWFSASSSGPMLALHAVALSGKHRLIAQAPGAIRLEDVSRDGRALGARISRESGAFALAPGETRERDLSWLEWSVPRDLSADGKTLLMDEQSAPVGGNYAVCIRKTDGSPVVRLGEGFAVALSPDGKWALSRLPAEKQPFTLLPTGAGEARKVAFEGFDDYRGATFLPDGREILFVSKKGQDPLRFYRGSIEGGKARPVTPPALGRFALSPDGRRLAAMGPQNMALIFFLEAGPDAPGRPVPGAGVGDPPVQWSADGRSIFMRRAGSADKAVRIFRVDLETGRWEPWKEIVPAETAGATVSSGVFITPDGKSYAYGMSRSLSQLYLVEGLQ